MQPVWGNNDGDVIYIRQRVNLLKDAVRAPTFFETLTAYLPELFKRDYQWAMVKKAIKTQG